MQPHRREVDEDGVARLAGLRATIDNLDAAIVHLLAERFRCTKQVGALKARHGMPPADPEREAQQVELRRLAVEADLDPVFAEKSSASSSARSSTTIG